MGLLISDLVSVSLFKDKLPAAAWISKFGCHVFALRIENAF